MMATMVDGVVEVQEVLEKEATEADLATDLVVGDEVVLVSMGKGGIMEMEGITLTLNFSAS